MEAYCKDCKLRKNTGVGKGFCSYKHAYVKRKENASECPRFDRKRKKGGE